MTLVLAAYFCALSALALFGVHRLALTLSAWRAWRARRASSPVHLALPDDPPKVVLQLPIYNEAFVAERIITAAAALKYPDGRLEIQVLDDSTDETANIIKRVAADLARAGAPVKVVRRPSRQGFKAGALAYGLDHTDAEFVAILDADFIPDPDFLLRTVPVLAADDGCAMVQARWAHLNRDVSWLTRAQALYLDGHFGVEHAARSFTGHTFNFNGTAGVWRRQAIEEAGGWRDQTITEDLDLSYRAQLAGWHFAYVDDVLVPAELPELWMAFRSQQARWVKGSVETARLQLVNILRARQWPVGRRFEAALHITSNLTYVLMAAIGVLLPLTVMVRDRLGWMVPGGQPLLSVLDLSMLTAGTFAMIVFYAFAIRSAPEGVSRPRVWHLPFALCLGAGMSLSNAREVLLGFVSKGSEFVRTPKKGATSERSLVRAYRSPPGTAMAAIELLFAVYYAISVGYAVSNQLWGAIPFLLLYLIGFSAVGGGVMREALQRARAHRATTEAYSSSSTRTTSVT